MKKILKYFIPFLLLGGILAGLGYLSNGFTNWNIKEWFNTSKTASDEEAANDLNKESLNSEVKEENGISVKAMAQGVDENNHEYITYSYSLSGGNRNDVICFIDSNEGIYNSKIDGSDAQNIDFSVNRNDKTLTVTKLKDFTSLYVLRLSNSVASCDINIWCSSSLTTATDVDGYGTYYQDDFSENPFYTNQIKRLLRNDGGPINFGYVDYNMNQDNLHFTNGVAALTLPRSTIMSTVPYRGIYYLSFDINYSDSLFNGNTYGQMNSLFIALGLNINTVLSDLDQGGYPLIEITPDGVNWYSNNFELVASETGWTTPLSESMLGSSSKITITVGEGELNQWVAVSYGDKVASHQMLGQCNGHFAITTPNNRPYDFTIDNLKVDARYDSGDGIWGFSFIAPTHTSINGNCYTISLSDLKHGVMPDLYTIFDIDKTRYPNHRFTLGCTLNSGLSDHVNRLICRNNLSSSDECEFGLFIDDTNVPSVGLYTVTFSILDDCFYVCGFDNIAINIIS